MWNKKEKTAEEIRTSFRLKYLEYAKHLNELNKLIKELADETDEILSFMDTTIKLGRDLGIKRTPTLDGAEEYEKTNYNL